MNLRVALAATLASLAGLSTPLACSKTPEDPPGALAEGPQCEAPYVRAEINFRAGNDDLVRVSGTVNVSVFQADGKPATIRDKATGVQTPIKMLTPLHRESGLDICVEHGGAPLATNMVFEIIVPLASDFRRVSWVYGQFTNHNGRGLWSSQDYWPTEGEPINVNTTVQIGLGINGQKLPR